MLEKQFQNQYGYEQRARQDAAALGVPYALMNQVKIPTHQTWMGNRFSNPSIIPHSNIPSRMGMFTQSLTGGAINRKEPKTTKPSSTLLQEPNYDPTRGLTMNNELRDMASIPSENQQIAPLLARKQYIERFRPQLGGMEYPRNRPKPFTIADTFDFQPIGGPNVRYNVPTGELPRIPAPRAFVKSVNRTF